MVNGMARFYMWITVHKCSTLQYRSTVQYGTAVQNITVQQYRTLQYNSTVQYSTVQLINVFTSRPRRACVDKESYLKYVNKRPSLSGTGH